MPPLAAVEIGLYEKSKTDFSHVVNDSLVYYCLQGYAIK